jgi:L-ascorbate metabolism protein UlaG (beta-lactamase superfamily)
MSTALVRNYRRPASLGGPERPGADEITLRWFGTANFEVTFGDRVLLLDTYYNRSPRDRALGFTAEDVVRADLVLIGHPHADHVGDTAQVVRQTGARAVIAPLGADFLLGQGLTADQVVSAPGLGAGDVLDEDGFSVRVLHGLHLDPGLTPQQQEKSRALKAARDALYFDFAPPVTEAENEASAGFFQRGVHTPEVNTEATLTYVVDIDGFRIAYRDSGGPISDEEKAYFTEHPGVDLAIISINGLPHVHQQLEDVFLPLVRLYQPRVLVPSHHDELWVNLGDQGLGQIFNDVATEPIKLRVHDEFPRTITAQPSLIEPLTVNRSSGEVVLGELKLR